MVENDLHKYNIEANKIFNELIALIRDFPTYEWIRLISIYDNSPHQRMDIHNQNPITQYIQRFQRIAIAHYALRCSNNHRDSRRPFCFREYAMAVEKYMNSEMKIFKTIENQDIANKVYHALAPMVYEQFTNQYHPYHVFARCSYLYSKYEYKVRVATGLGLDEIIGIALMIACYVMRFRYFNEDAIELYCNNRYSREQINSFLNYYSVDVGKYKEECRKQIGQNIARNEFVLLHRYPIIKVLPGEYYSPVNMLLINAASKNIFHVILNAYESSGERNSFLREFGEQFEEYLRKLFMAVPYVLNECGSIEGIKGRENEKFAEFYIESNGGTLIVECKRFAFRRDTLISGSPNDVEEHINRVIPDAVEQVKNTMHHLKRDNAIGLIVTFDYLPLANSGDFPAKLPSNIILASIDDVEILLSLSSDEMFDILNKFKDLPSNEKGDLNQMFKNIDFGERCNRFLSNEYKNIMRLVVSQDTQET